MPATAVEQMILELINRARLDPAAEATRDGIDLNEGLPAGTISTASKQPLAMNETLLAIARAHDQDMIAHNYFAHVDFSGNDPFVRMTAAGYGWTTAGENIAWNGTSGAVTQQMSIDMEQLLFVDASVAGRGHRLNLLNGAFQEVGAGVVNGVLQGFNATLLTQDFGSVGAGQFLTGVSYVDSDHNNFYSIGEGRSGVAVSVTGGGSTTTAGAGGYSMAIGSGQQTVTFSGGLASPVSVAVTILSNTSAKVDMVDQGVVATSASLTNLGGATRIIGLGTIGLTLTGNNSAETFSGTKGNDVISGGGGFDSVIFAGVKSAYSITNMGGGSVQVAGPEGTDALTSIERLFFTDQTVNLSPPPPKNDFGGDGRSDVLLRNASGISYLWSMNGTIVSNGATTSVQVGTNWRIKGLGDFNGDASSDILWTYNNASNAADALNGVSYVSFQNGAAASGGGVVQQLSSAWQVAGVGDFNGDGMADVLYRNSSTGQTYLDIMHGSSVTWALSGFTSQQVTSANWHVAAVADFNDDGNADVLWRYSNAANASDPLNGALYEWQMNGTNVTSAGLLSQQAGAAWQVAGTGDFNGDGEADILFRNSTSGQTYIDFMNGAVVKSGAATQWQIDNSWALASIGDFNADGKSDILFQQASTGNTYIWSMNGANVTSGAFTSQQAGAGWTVQNGVLIG